MNDQHRSCRSQELQELQELQEFRSSGVGVKSMDFIAWKSDKSIPETENQPSILQLLN